MGLQDEVDVLVSSAFIDADGMMGVEEVTYTPYGARAKTINVNVMRNTTMMQDGVVVRELRIFVSRADITSIDRTGDTVTIADRYGERAVEKRVVGIIKEDAGGFLLRLE